MNKRELRGIIPAIITPLDKDRKIDKKLFEKQMSYLSDAGVDGFFISGTTGEGPYLSREERIDIFEIARSAKKDDQFLCAACIMPSTEQTLEEIGYFEKLEPDFIVAVTPFYYSVSQEVLIEHFKRIASVSPVPLIVYNIPQCTHNKIEYSTVIELSKTENIAGIKDSSGDFVTFSRWCYSDMGNDFSVVQGEDYLDGPSLLIGSRGIVTGLGNVWIEPYVEMYRAVLENDTERVNELQKAIDRLYKVIEVSGGKVIPAIKAACSLLGRSSIFMRTRGDEVDRGSLKNMEGVLKDLGIL